jgi:hypothetical protein
LNNRKKYIETDEFFQEALKCFNIIEIAAHYEIKLLKPADFKELVDKITDKSH